MPDLTVELAFTYKRTYSVTADTEYIACRVAEAVDSLEHEGVAMPADVKGMIAIAESNREFAEYEDSRVFNDQGEEIFLYD